MSALVKSRLSWRAWRNASVTFALISASLALIVAGQKLLVDRDEALWAEVFKGAVTFRAHGAERAFTNTLSEDWRRTAWTAEQLDQSPAGDRQKTIDALVAAPGRVIWAGFADLTGHVIVASDGVLVGADVSSRPWFRSGLLGQYAGDAHDGPGQTFLDPSGEQPMRLMDFALPVTNRAGAVIGVFGVHLDAGWAQDYLRDIASALGLELMLVDQGGRVSVDATAKPGQTMPRDLSLLSPGQARLMEWSDGQDYFTIMVAQRRIDDMPSFGWRLVARVDQFAFFSAALPAHDLPLMLAGESATLQTVFAILASLGIGMGGAAVFFGFRARRATAETGTALQRLASSEQRFHVLFGTASLPIVVIRGRAYKTANDAAARLLGYATPALLEGKNILDLSPEVQPDGARSADKAALIRADLTAKGSVRFDWLHLKADGTTILLNVILTLFETETGREVFGVWTDVTARRKAEETVREYQTMLERAVAVRTEELEATSAALQEAKDRSDQMAKLRTDFLATMSHEIRGPLNSMIGFVELASEGHLNRQQAGFLAKAVQSGRHLASIVDDVLDLTRVEAGRLELENVAFDLIDFAHATFELIEPALRDKPVELVFDVAPDLPATISADPLRLRQILMNYLTNAAKFTQAGEIALALCRVDRDGHTFLRFSVEDTGIGLRPEQQIRLFQSFAQADISTARLYGGSGLGLAICQQLSVLMEGHVGFTSEAGQGSRFWFDLPYQAHVTDERVAFVGRAPEGQVVWLAVSLIRRRKVIRTWLERAGFTVRDIGPTPSPLPRDAVVISDPVAQQNMTWFDPAGFANHFTLGDDRTQAKDRTAKTIRTPIHPRRLVASLLPAARPQDGAQDATRPAQPPPRLFPSGLKVLVADDDSLNRDLAQARLKRHGLAVRTAANGAEALQAVLEERFDLILMDHQMPGIDGIEATRRIRALPPTRAHTPIIGVSGSDRQDVREACALAGMDGFLLKPLSAAKLAEVLERFLPA